MLHSTLDFRLHTWSSIFVILKFKHTYVCAREWLQEMATSSTKLNLVVKKNTKSVVWQYFGLEIDEKNILKQEMEDQLVCRCTNVNNIEILRWL